MEHFLFFKIVAGLKSCCKGQEPQDDELLVSTRVGLVLTFEHTGLVPCALVLGTFLTYLHMAVNLVQEIFFSGLRLV
jgi:hypothetical protein